ncbi:MAG TPA: zf-HC2 domain-containing protein [Myxococcales bacterium]|nr:zf-HC2 domain-containing protein [Myxococcales bacterium]
MTSSDRKLSCARAQVLLEAAVDGTLRPRREAELQMHLRACPACSVELATARRVQAGLRELPRWTCPPAVVDEVLRRTRADSEPSRRWLPAWASLAWWRPVLAAASVAALALAIALLGRQPAPGPQDLVRAEQEARWALALVAELTQRAAMTSVGEVVGGVIGEQAIAPVTDAVQESLEKVGKPKDGKS